MSDEIVPEKRRTRNPLPSRDRLAELLSYAPETGEFRWKIAASRCVKVGDVAGRINSRGYRQIGIDGKIYYAHRLAFMVMKGECPDAIDHANRDPSDNRWVNIRAATMSQNSGNRGMGRRNTSGVKGVSWNRAAGKWCVSIMIHGQKRYLGYFDCVAKLQPPTALLPKPRLANLQRHSVAMKACFRMILTSAKHCKLTCRFFRQAAPGDG